MRFALFEDNVALDFSVQYMLFCNKIDLGVLTGWPLYVKGHGACGGGVEALVEDRMAIVTKLCLGNGRRSSCRTSSLMALGERGCPIAAMLLP